MAVWNKVTAITHATLTMYIPYAYKFSQDETFTDFVDEKPCVKIWVKYCAMTKTAINRK